MPDLDKIIRILKKTGDKAIVLDEHGDPRYVIMTLPDYERLVLARAEVEGLSEEELLDKINRDIAVWKDDRDSIEIEDLPIEQHDFSSFLAKDSENFDYNDEFDQLIEPTLSESGVLPGLAEVARAETEEDRYYFEPVE